MDRDDEIDIIRCAYAKRVLAAAGVRDRRIEAAFAAVPREHFLGRGPWPILRWGRGYVNSPSRDLIYLYDDVLVGIIPERNLNNGQPWLHALLIAGTAPRIGEHAVHIGAGVGYYTAILAHLVGHRGRVTAIEFDSGLAQRVAANFADAPNVRVMEGDGSRLPFDPADIIYVNAGATRPADSWLDGLKEGGRLILPLTTNQGFLGPESVPIERRGAVFRIERRGDEYAAKRISAVAIFPCEGMRDPASEAALAAAFEKGDGSEVRRLYRRGDVPEDECWLHAADWAHCLSLITRCRIIYIMENKRRLERLVKPRVIEKSTLGADNWQQIVRWGKPADVPQTLCHPAGRHDCRAQHRAGTGRGLQARQVSGRQVLLHADAQADPDAGSGRAPRKRHLRGHLRSCQRSAQTAGPRHNPVSRPR